MAACNLVYRTLLFLPGGGVEYRHYPCYPTLLEYLFDGYVIFLRAYEGQDPALTVLSLVAFKYLFRPLRQRNTYHRRTLPFGLAGYILHRIVYNIRRGQAHEVGNAASDTAMEYEYVALDCE